MATATTTATALKFIISSGAWLKALTRIAGAINNNPVVPILENVLLRVANGVATLTTSDLQTTLSTSLPVEAAAGSNLAICIPGRMLLDTLKALPDQPVTVTVGEDYSIVLKSVNGGYKLAGENAADYPTVTSSRGELVRLTLNAMELRSALAATLPVVSRDELRPAMTGVLIDLALNNVVKFVATDGHRLNLLTLPRPGMNWGGAPNVIIPGGAGRLLAGLVRDVVDNEVVLELYQSRAVVTLADGTSWQAQLIDERYPDYNNVIPVSNPSKLLMNRAELLASVRRIERFSNRTTHQVRLKLSGHELMVSAEDLDFNNSANEVFSVQYDGADMEIGFNARFLIEELALLQGEQVLLEMSTPNRAGLLSDGDGGAQGQLLCLVMPVMLNNYV